MGSIIAEFDARHGEYLICDGWVYFCDGAIRENSRIGILKEPPEDGFHCAMLKQQFCQLALRGASKRFNDRKSDLLVTIKRYETEKYCENVPISGAAAIAELETLKADVQARKKALRKVEEELAVLKPKALSDREAASEETRKRLADVRNALAAIEI